MTRQASDNVATVRCDIDAEHQQSAPEATCALTTCEQNKGHSDSDSKFISICKLTDILRVRCA